MNDTEREAIILNTVWQMIDEMVNWGKFEKFEHIEPATLAFTSSEARTLFAVLLGDFLSDVRTFKGEPMPLGLMPVPSGARPSDLTMLFHLREVCRNPKLGLDASSLAAATEAFGDWLEGEFVSEGVNLSTIDVVTDLRVPRIRYLKMCGDIAKHSLARLSTNVRHLRRLLADAGHDVSEQDAYLAVDDFAEWYLRGIFIYHSSYIGEFLNNIRWAIYEYLLPEFGRSWHLTDKATELFPIYSYRVPADITEPLAKGMYWGAMNRTRSPPYVQRFVVSDSFKTLY